MCRSKTGAGDGGERVAGVCGIPVHFLNVLTERLWLIYDHTHLGSGLYDHNLGSSNKYKISDPTIMSKNIKEKN